VFREEQRVAVAGNWRTALAIGVAITGRAQGATSSLTPESTGVADKAVTSQRTDIGNRRAPILSAASETRRSPLDTVSTSAAAA
jgi:hypothetical protein